MRVKHTVPAVLLGIVVAQAGAQGALASSDFIKVMTDPCAKVMNWSARAVSYNVTPPSERGLQCPIQDLGASFE